MKLINDTRPLSPHLQIYKLPLVAILSITHRVTGVFLSVAICMLIWVISLNVFMPKLMLVEGMFYHILLACFLLLFFLSMYYHLLNGIRHLLWDLGYGFSLLVVQIGNILILSGTVLLTFLTYYLLVLV